MRATREEFCTVAEAAELAGVSAMTIRRHADRGRLEAVRTPYGRAILRRDAERMGREPRRRGATR